MEIARYIRAALIALLLLAPVARGQLVAEPQWLAGYDARLWLRITGNGEAPFPKSVIARIPTGDLCRDDAGDVTVVTSDGTELPIAVLSHAPAGHTVIQFERQPEQRDYWAYIGHKTAAPKRREPIDEGVVLEVRNWKGMDMSSWPAVREGLETSGSPLDSFVVGEMMHNSNPARPGDPTEFAASYRGYINIEEDGPYRFMVNGDDASFLFIDGFLVCERPGQNTPLRGRIPVEEVGNVIELTKGRHRIEIHHVMGESATAYGLCVLMWFPPGQKGSRQSWQLCPKDMFAHAANARVVQFRCPKYERVAGFVSGIDDTLTTNSGMKLYLVQFAAQSEPMPAGDDLMWDFGDGTTGRGRRPLHVYFEEGDYTVSVKVGEKGRTFHQRVHVWPAPTKTSPFSPLRVIEWFSSRDWRHEDEQRIYQMFDFLLICDQPQRWFLMEQVTRHLLSLGETDPQFIADLYTARIEALGQLNRTDEALKLAAEGIKRFEKLGSQKLEVQLAEARIYQRHLRDLPEAARKYEAIIDEHRRLDDPLLRVAATRWGDVCARAGDRAQAATCYRLADTLGGDAFRTTAVTEAVSHGALLRVAEQELRKGDINKTRSLLDKIELQNPEQKLNGMYRFLHAEVSRFGGAYDEALSDYEALIQMQQWAGYRDRATYGIADTYMRMGDYDRALRWLASLREHYPDFGEAEKLDKYQEMVTELGKRASEGRPLLDAIVDDLEPIDGTPHEMLGAFFVEQGLGIMGPHVATMENHAKYQGYLDYAKHLEGLVPGGWYWVELWYRETLLQSRFQNGGHIHTWLYGSDNKMHEGFHNEGTGYFDRTYGRWRKFGFMHKAPVTVDGRLALSLRYNWGDMELDGLSIMRVTDQQYDALANFIEGAGEETEPIGE